MRGLPGEGRVPASPAAEAVSSRRRGEEEPFEDAQASTGEEETVLRSMGVRDSGILGEGLFRPDASSLPGARGVIAIRAAVI
jgi:hypothetical protein